MSVKVLIDSVEKIKDFVGITNHANCDIDLVSGRNTYLDAKSIMGILSCDFKKPMKLNIYADEKYAKTVINELRTYIVE